MYFLSSATLQMLFMDGAFFFFFYDLHQDLESVTVNSEAAPAGATSGEPAEIETAHVEASGACSVGEQKTAHVEASGAATIIEPEEEPAHIETSWATTVSEPAEMKTAHIPPATAPASGSETPTDSDGDLMGDDDAPSASSRPPLPKGLFYDSDGDLMGDDDAPVCTPYELMSSNSSSSSSSSS